MEIQNKKEITLSVQDVQDILFDHLAEVSPWDLSGTAEDIYKELHQTQINYLKNREDIIEANWTWENGEYEGEDGRFILTITRLENDKEYNSRVKQLMKIGEQEKILKQKQEQSEYEEYLRLKQKFTQIPKG
jgi:hypothetical protein